MIPTKKEIQLIRSLNKKKGREKSGLFVIEGEKLIEEARHSGIEILKEFSREKLGVEMMSRISHLASPSPLLALAKKPFESPFEMPKEGSLYLALDSINDPGNFGTIIRVAEWFGVEAIYCSLNSVDLYNPKVVQSTMGSLFRVKIFYIDLAELLQMAKKRVPIYGTFLEGESLIESNMAEERGALFVMGSESEGISSQLENYIEKRVTIPPYPKIGEKGRGADSLNVAISTAICCWHFRGSVALPPQKG